MRVLLALPPGTREGAPPAPEPLGRGVPGGVRAQEEEEDPLTPAVLRGRVVRGESFCSPVAREPSAGFTSPPCHGRCCCRGGPHWRASASVPAAVAGGRGDALGELPPAPAALRALGRRAAGKARRRSARKRAAAVAPLAGRACSPCQAHCSLRAAVGSRGGAGPACGTLLWHRERRWGKNLKQ